MCVCVCVRPPLTSARVVFDQELVQSHPPSPDSHHHGAAQDPHQTQLLRVAELQVPIKTNEEEEREESRQTGDRR